jgi:DNA-binding response OmpR family regulator
VLIVEDDETLRESLRYTLALEGYDVRAVADGLAGLRSAEEDPPSAIVLDLMLPGMDGLEVCRQIRRKSQVPIMMLTAKREEVDKVVGLEVGADDYMTKPFSMRELVARMRALLRRAEYGGESRQESAILRCGAISVDTRRREVTRDGALVALRPKEYELLTFLARNPGQVFSRQQLLDQVWGYEFFGGSRTVDVHVRWLREKIERDPSSPEFLHTVRGAGYRLDA